MTWSLLIHALGIAIILILLGGFPSLDRPKLPELNHNTIEIIVESPLGVHGRQETQTPQKKSKTKEIITGVIPKKDIPQFKDLNLGLSESKSQNADQNAANQNDTNQNVANQNNEKRRGQVGSQNRSGKIYGELEEEGTGDGFTTANQMSTSKEADLYPFFKAIWKKINSAVFYPDEFTQRRIAGSVQIQFIVAQDGTFTGQFISNQADHEYLKTYAMTMVSYALREPLPKNLWSDRKKIVISASFHFKVKILTAGEVPDNEPDMPHFKNIMEFKRTGYAKSKVTEAFERFYDRYFPPIIVLPGGVAIDFIRAYKLIKNYGKIDGWDVMDHRDERLKEKWGSLIQPRT